MKSIRYLLAACILCQSLPATGAIPNKECRQGIVLMFHNSETASPEVFEKKYALKLKQKLRSGYYIFENISTFCDNELINEIKANEANIKTIRINKRLHNVPF